MEKTQKIKTKSESRADKKTAQAENQAVQAENPQTLKPVTGELHAYTKGEEILNVVTHGVGALFGVFILIFGIIKSIETGLGTGIPATMFFAFGMMITYGISAVYHGLKSGKAKYVLRVIDHCTVYVLIIGTYAGILLTAILSYAPVAAYVLLAVELAVGAAAITLTAINMKKYRALSMVCYIILGWSIIAIPHIAIQALSLPGFLWLLGGGIAYTVGSVLYGIGRKKRYMHGVFHIFCLIGSVLQFVAFAVYCL